MVAVKCVLIDAQVAESRLRVSTSTHQQIRYFLPHLFFKPEISAFNKSMIVYVTCVAVSMLAVMIRAFYRLMWPEALLAIENHMSSSLRYKYRDIGEDKSGKIRCSYKWTGTKFKHTRLNRREYTFNKKKKYILCPYEICFVNGVITKTS
jgi:hypothetical protein